MPWPGSVLGLERWHEEAWGDCPAIVGVGTTAVALFPVGTDRPHPPPGRGVLAMKHLAFRATAADFAAAQQELTRRGIAFESQDHQISRSIYFDDPDGHLIEITTYQIG